MLSQKITELNHLPNYQVIVALCKIRALNLFFVQDDAWNDENTGDQLSADALWSKAKFGKLQVCEYYESWSIESVFGAAVEAYHEFHAFAVDLLGQKTLKYGYKKDHLLAHNISKEAIDVISNFADWKPSTRSLFSGYTGSIFAHETIKMLSEQDFYLANDCPSDDVLRELAELAEEMFVNG